MEVKVKSKGDGVYACSYTPASSLKHTLAITWGGVSIPKSPFRVSSRSQLAAKTGSFVLSKSEHLSTEAAEVDRSENVVKAEKFGVVQSEQQTHLTQTTYSIESQKTKRPLIVIITYTEEILE